MSRGYTMETIVDFIGKMSEMIKKSMDETSKCIGKDIVDISAGKKGICIDRITNFLDAKISFLGVKYSKEEQEKIKSFSTDVLVCQAATDRVFIPMNEINAVGESIILLKSELKVPEITVESTKKNDVFKRYHLTNEAIKDVLPSVVPKDTEKENKGWLKKLVGE